MSFIRLKLPPAKKAWKSVTSTFLKLRKIHGFKAMKKPRTTAPATKRSKFLTRSLRNITVTGFRSAIHGFHKKPAPVYIDKLFKEPACDLVEHLRPQIANNPRTKRTMKLPDRPAAVAGVSKGARFDKPCSSDDMWESLALASPLMRGINERAEEFIARFREEMMAQEIVASNL